MPPKVAGVKAGPNPLDANFKPAVNRQLGSISPLAWLAGSMLLAVVLFVVWCLLFFVRCFAVVVVVLDGGVRVAVAVVCGGWSRCLLYWSRFCLVFVLPLLRPL